MSDLAAKVRGADQRIAARWQARVAKKMDKPVLTPADIDYIVADLVRRVRNNQDITQNEGEVLVLITNASIDADPKRSDAGIVRLVHYVDQWEKALRLNLQPLLSEEELSSVADHLRGGAVSQIIFTSPGTGITYAPYDYVAVAKLILDKEINVLISKTSGLSEYATTRGFYTSETNLLIINTATPLNARLTLVHEATHAIQDWQDVSHLAKFHEADAFIADAIARRSVTTEVPDSPIKRASAVAADIVIRKAATAGSKDWKNAYDAVVAAVVREYKNAGDRYDHVRGETRIEKPVFVSLLGAIKVANVIADVGEGAKRVLRQALLLR